MLTHACFPAPARLMGPRPGPRLRRALLAMVLLAVLWPAAARADRADQDAARRAVQSGEVLPLPAILERLQKEQPGKVLGVELEQEGGRWIYEIRLLGADGRLMKVKRDARTGAAATPAARDAARPGSGRSDDRHPRNPR